MTRSPSPTTVGEPLPVAPLRNGAGPGRRRSESRGSSLIELLIAAALLGVALMALAPLFLRAAADVRQGASRSRAAALAQEALEMWRPGAATGAAPRIEYYDRSQRRWIDGAPAPGEALWVREISVRSYPAGAAEDGRLERSEAHAAATPIDAGAGLLSIRVAVARRLGDPPLVRLERIEWIAE